MADTQAPQRSLWLQVLWKPVFRSRRERVGHTTSVAIVTFMVLLPIGLLRPFDSVVATAVCMALGVTVLHGAAWLAWLTWGRERFPLKTAGSFIR